MLNSLILNINVDPPNPCQKSKNAIKNSWNVICTQARATHAIKWCMWSLLSPLSRSPLKCPETSGIPPAWMQKPYGKGTGTCRWSNFCLGFAFYCCHIWNWSARGGWGDYMHYLMAVWWSIPEGITTPSLPQTKNFTVVVCLWFHILLHSFMNSPWSLDQFLLSSLLKSAEAW